MLEKDIEKRVCQWVEKEGGIALKIKLDSQRGFPDRLIILPDMVLFVELKKPKTGKKSPHQSTWLDVLVGLDQHAFVCTSLSFLMRYVEGVRDRSPS